jgi:hypothetical protein
MAKVWNQEKLLDKFKEFKWNHSCSFPTNIEVKWNYIHLPQSVLYKQSLAKYSYISSFVIEISKEQNYAYHTIYQLQEILFQLIRTLSTCFLVCIVPTFTEQKKQSI